MKAPAFNGRFEPPTFAGLPLGTAIGGAVALLALPLALLMPWWAIKVLFLLAAAGGAAAAVYFARLGEEVPFRGVRSAAARERQLLTHDWRGGE